MKFVIIGLFLAVVIAVVLRGRGKKTSAEQACANEIGKLVAKNPDASLDSIAEIFTRHGISRERCSSVGRLVMPQLRKNGVIQDDAPLLMRRVKDAYDKVPEET